MNKKIYDLAIIGAGPAGMMAAVAAANYTNNIILLEKNSTPGIKLLMTGKERCNLTNAETDIRKFSANFGKKGKFLLSALHHFGIEETINFFHQHNILTKIERGGRIFPESNKAQDIQNLFVNILKEKKITFSVNNPVRAIQKKENYIEKIQLKSGVDIIAKNCIIATGGLSYPQTGSDGQGYKWAKKLGHTIIPPSPALTPLIVKENWLHELEGLSLKNVAISIYQNDKKQDERFGEALFTNFGLSGPIVLDISKRVGELLESGTVNLFIDFKPALDFDVLDRRILRDLENGKNKLIKNILHELLPSKMIPVILKLTDISPEQKGNTITKEQRKKLRLYLKKFPFTIERLFGFNKAIITSGGVTLTEIDPNTMRSKIVPNLYFAGEILDIDGPTGGYNLQICWSTGYLAGESAAK